MTCIRRPAAVSTALTFFLTAAIASSLNVVRADIPEPPQSSIPCQINLVGSTGGVADGIGETQVVIRDFARNPLAGAVVTIDFSACTDLRIATSQPFPGVEAHCDAPIGTVTATTNAAGIATFRIVGGARNSAGGAPGAGYQCALVYADGVLIGRVNIGAFDQNGIGGVNPVDVSVWLMDFFTGQITGTYFGRSDFDCSQTLSPADLSRLLSASIAGGSTTSGAAYCN